MTSRRPSFRLAAPSLLLAVALVSGSAGPAIARDASPHGGAFGGSTIRVSGRSDAAARGTSASVGRAAPRWLDTERVRPQGSDAGPAPAVRLPTADVPVAKARSVPKGDASSGGAATATTYRGRNHVWIPSLGVSKSISFFACSSKAYPGDRVYRWGCAGSNNVYLFGHAHSVFKPLHDAYVSGRLQKGMVLYYAGNDGVVHTYKVRWWKVTTPDKGAWAYAGQSAPSLTLQTCVGAKSQFRLVVRLVRTD